MGGGYEPVGIWEWRDEPPINHLAGLEEQLQRDGIRTASDRHAAHRARALIMKRRRKPRKRDRRCPKNKCHLSPD